MKSPAFLILSLGAIIIAGSAAAGPAKDAASGKVMYTSAPREVAFKASCEALEKLGYKIEKKDADNFLVTGSYVNPWAGRAPRHAQISVTKEAAVTKITYTVDRRGALKALDVAGYFSADNIYKEIEKILARNEINYRKANKDREERRERESSDEGSYQNYDHGPKRAPTDMPLQ